MFMIWICITYYLGIYGSWFFSVQNRIVHNKHVESRLLCSPSLWILFLWFIWIKQERWVKKIIFYTFLALPWNKGCTREFLYIRNSNPRLKLALLTEKCAAGMHVNTHSCPLRTEKLTKFLRFLSRLTLTSEGGEWIKKKPRRDFCHLICTWQGRRGWNKRILKQLKCYWQNQKQGSGFRCFFKKVDNLGILLHFFFWD